MRKYSSVYWVIKLNFQIKFWTFEIELLAKTEYMVFLSEIEPNDALVIDDPKYSPGVDPFCSDWTG